MVDATANGNTYLPAACPSSGPGAGMRIPTVTVDENGRRVTGTLNSGLSAIKTATQAMGSNASVDGNKAYDAAIKTLENVAPALRKLSAQVVEDADRRENAVAKKLGIKPLSLKSSLGKVSRAFPGSISGSGLSSSALNNGSEALESKAKEMEKEQAKKFNFKPLDMPNFNNNLGAIGSGSDSTDFFSDSDLEAKRTQVMNDLDMEQNTVNENANGNIFKMITNRYLLSYPKLLNEKK